MKTFFEKWMLCPLLVVMFFIPVIFITGGTSAEMIQVSAVAGLASVCNNLMP
jgi:hypothetical protein